MKAISLLQPWASLIACKAKTCETRSWRPAHLGPLAIHASARFPAEFRKLCDEWPFCKYVMRDLPLGAIVAVARLVKIETTDRWRERYVPNADPRLDEECEFGDYGLGRYAWHLMDVIALPAPIPCKGSLSLWTVPPDVEAQLCEALNHGTGGTASAVSQASLFEMSATHP
jgi:hypothetical protein